MLRLARLRSRGIGTDVAGGADARHGLPRDEDLPGKGLCPDPLGHTVPARRGLLGVAAAADPGPLQKDVESHQPPVTGGKKATSSPGLLGKTNLHERLEIP